MTGLVKLVSELIAIDSVNPDLVPGGAGEGETARFVAEWLERAGIDVEVQETTPGRRNVIGIVRGNGGGKSLMLNAHMDTVGLGGPDGALTARVEGNRLYGRGSFDMKGSLAAVMLAAADLVKDRPNGNVLVTAVTDEEYASTGTQAILERFSADGAIVTEPTGLQTCIAHKGFVWAEIETFGEAAHGSGLNAAIDAIAKMGRVLVGLEELDRSLRAQPKHPLVETASVHASLIGGGIGLSTYPDRCLLQIERRTVPGETAETVRAELEAIIARGREGHPHFRAEARLGIERDPYEIAADAAIVVALRRVAKRIAGSDRIFNGTFGWMDSALLSAAGIPTVVFGPTGDGAHSDTEWVDIDSVELCRRVYVAMAREFSG